MEAKKSEPKISCEKEKEIYEKCIKNFSPSVCNADKQFYDICLRFDRINKLGYFSFDISQSPTSK